MTNFIAFVFNSSAELWQSIPLISFHYSLFSFIFSANLWAVTAAVLILILAWSNPQNNAYAQAGNSAVDSLRKSVYAFWNGQILERVHLKWRDLSSRLLLSNILKDQSALSTSAQTVNIQTNRLPAAWISLSPVQRKTTGVWVTVLFFVLLTSNAFGLVPLCGLITAQAGTTLGYSLLLLTLITFAGVQRLKVRFVRLFLPSGPSWPMAPLFILLESVSYSFRAISLGVRLWLNVFSGHLLLHLFTAFLLVPVFSSNLILALPITALAAGLLMALTGLETMVAVLQSGVFGLLSSFYLTEVLSKRDSLSKAV
uniref:ATP synthase subunit a n=2 Tax=Pediastrum duplex TaxID=3105 RepID=A0A5P8TYA7_PEDDU|nr:ATP synthase F0 subunit 6 [Pediastrum duplex f. asperum]QFS20021.1 ATP synthase F0 subunit 6 [Pediastrum duplex]